MDQSNNNALVIDHGSYKYKVGFSGEGEPRYSLRSVYGTVDQKNIVQGDEAMQLFYQNQEQIKLNMLFNNGLINQWEEWNEADRFWNYIYQNKLRVNPEEHPCFITQPQNISKTNLEKLTKQMFETHKFPSFFASIGQILSLYSTGRTTGVVFDCGESQSTSIPIYEGIVQKASTQSTSVGGKDIHILLGNQIQKNESFNSNRSQKIPIYKNYEFLRLMKETLCYQALDNRQELKSYYENPEKIDRSFIFPDGSTVSIGQERFLTTEVLFDPSLVNKNQQSIEKVIFNSISTLKQLTDSTDHLTYGVYKNKKLQIEEKELHKLLYENILLVGGNSQMQGFQERLNREVTNLAPNNVNVTLQYPKNRNHSIWIGGSILTSLSSFQDSWIQKAEYEEYGPNIVHKKCLF